MSLQKKQGMKKRCLITGKLVPVQSQADLVEPRRLPPVVKQGRTAEVADELAGMRQQWVTMSPSDRCNRPGVKLSAAYRRLSHEFWHLTGRFPPRIYDDL